jgi:hypothetical protein
LGAVAGSRRGKMGQIVPRAPSNSDADSEFAASIVVAAEMALSRQISIGDFRRRIRPSALVIREQKQWSSSPPSCAGRQYRIYSDNADPRIGPGLERC